MSWSRRRCAHGVQTGEEHHYHTPDGWLVQTSRIHTSVLGWSRRIVHFWFLVSDVDLRRTAWSLDVNQSVHFTSECVFVPAMLAAFKSLLLYLEMLVDPVRLTNRCLDCVSCALWFCIVSWDYAELRRLWKHFSVFLGWNRCRDIFHGDSSVIRLDLDESYKHMAVSVNMLWMAVRRISKELFTERWSSVEVTDDRTSLSVSTGSELDCATSHFFFVYFHLPQRFIFRSVIYQVFYKIVKDEVRDSCFDK